MFDTYIHNVYETFRTQTGVALERLLSTEHARNRIRYWFESGYDEDECVWQLQEELDTLAIHV